MSADLVIDDGVVVATDAMLATMDTCDRAAGEVAAVARDLAITAARLDGLGDGLDGGCGDGFDGGLGGGAVRSMRQAADEAAVAARLADDAALPAGRLAHALRFAIHGYGVAETAATHAVEFVAEQVAAALGRLLPGLALAVAPGVVGVVGAAILLGPRLATALGRREELDAVGAAVGEAVNRVVSRPEVVSAIRVAVMSADDAIVGAIGVPPLAAGAIGEDGLGITGLPFVAGLAAGAAGAAGLLRETPVRLEATRVSAPAAPAPPQGWSERFARIPSPGEDDGMQVVVERYERPGSPPRYEVYVAGTVTFDPVAGVEPWDMTSNVQNAMGADAASVRAVLEALRASGADATTPVQLTGYSQGAAVVARVATVAEAEGLNVVGLVGFGGNTGQTPIPDDITTVLVEHDDDLVPALGGRQDNDHALLVRREAYADEPPPAGVAVPSHRRPAYAATAELMDAATSERMRTVGATVDAFAADAASVTRIEYRFERVVAP